MAGLNVIPVQDEILAYVMAEFPNYEVYEDVVLDEDSLLKTNNKIKPYIVIRWGGVMRNPRGGSFAGVRFDEYMSSFNVSVIAPTPKQCRKALNIIYDKLVGWKPNGGTPLIPETSGVYVVSDFNGKPHIYIGSSTMSFAVNNENPGQNITP